jgi:large subunit ribosomal protein L25
MAQELILMAEPRTVLGKQVRALRRKGLIPGVVYGPALEGTVQVSVNRRDLERFYLKHGQSALFTLNWDGGTQQVFIREVQIDPVKRNALHVDFFAPNLTKALTAQVPVVLHNHDAHAEGVLMQLLEQVEVRGLPSELPSQLDADISRLLAPGDVIHVSDIKMPGSVEAITPADAVVATLVASAAEEAAEAVEETAAETEEPAPAAE